MSTRYTAFLVTKKLRKVASRHTITIAITGVALLQDATGQKVALAGFVRGGHAAAMLRAMKNSSYVSSGPLACIVSSDGD